MIRRSLLVLSAVLVVVHGLNSENGPTGDVLKTTSVSKSTGNGLKATLVSGMSAVSVGNAHKLTPPSEESAASTGNSPKATYFSGESVSSDRSKSEPPAVSFVKPKNSEPLESSVSSSADASRPSPDMKNKDSDSSDNSDDKELSSKQDAESIQGSSEESVSHMAQQVSSGNGRPDVSTPRPTVSTNSSVVMVIPSKVPSTLQPKYNSSSPSQPSNFNKNNSTSGGEHVQAEAQGSAVKIACGSLLAMFAVSVHLIVSL